MTESRPVTVHLKKSYGLEWLALAVIVSAFGIITVYIHFKNQEQSQAQQALQSTNDARYQAERLKEDVQTQVYNLKAAQQSKLENCLAAADKTYQDTFMLNSSPSPQEGYPDSRTWNNGYIKQQTEQKQQSDKALCVQEFPPSPN